MKYLEINDEDEELELRKGKTDDAQEVAWEMLADEEEELSKEAEELRVAQKGADLCEDVDGQEYNA